MKRQLMIRYYYGTFMLESGTGKVKTDYYDLSAMKSRDAAVDAGWKKMEELTGSKQSITITTEGRELDGSDWPGEGFDIGDAVDSPGIDSTGPTDLDTWKCVGVLTSADPNGYSVAIPTLQSQSEEYSVRFNRWLTSLNAGTLGGRSSAAPSSEALSGIPTGPVTEPNLPNFTLSGDIGVTQSPLWEATEDVIALGFIFTIRQPGATFNLAFYQNGTVLIPIAVPAATSRYRGAFAMEIEQGDLIGCVISAAGAGAEDLTIQLIGGPLLITDEAFGTSV